MGKSIFMSKTFWANLIALIAIVVNYYKPTWSLTPEMTAYILIAINWLLRIITGEPIVWDKNSHKGRAV